MRRLPASLLGIAALLTFSHGCIFAGSFSDTGDGDASNWELCDDNDAARDGECSDTSDDPDTSSPPDTSAPPDTSSPPDTSQPDSSGGPDTGCESRDEVCGDRLSNDCDDVIDEGCPCNYADSSNGVCPDGTISEERNGACRPPEAWEARESRCDDGLDNDCDGAADDEDSNCRKRPGERCAKNGDCYSDRCVDAPSSSSPDQVCAHRIFVSSTTSDGNLGGLNGADEMCNKAAEQAGLGGDWKAVLSTPETPVKDRLVFDGPIYNLGGDEFASGPGQLWDDRDPSNAVTYTEHGGEVDGRVWTGTLARGAGDEEDHCTRWTSNSSRKQANYGNSDRDDNGWIDVGGSHADCSEELHLYCVDGQPDDGR